MVSKSLKFGLKWQFLCFKPIFVSHFFTKAAVKFKQMPKFYTSVILLINQLKEISKKQFSVMTLKGANIDP